MRLISLVLPVYNEEQNILRAYEALCGVFDRLGTYDIEFVFTDNHSEDGTFRVFQDLAARDRRVKVLRFNRNYGFQRSPVNIDPATHRSPSAPVNVETMS